MSGKAEYVPPGVAGEPLWRRSAGALPYGYGLYYIAQVEGCPTLFLEVLSDAITPTGYALDATLVVDHSARLGSLVAADSAIAKGFDFELRLLDSVAVRALMSRPALRTPLAAALSARATTLTVIDARPFAAVEKVYIGTSCIPITGVGDKTFTGATRTTYGRARSYPVGTLVTEAPAVWQGRRVDLWAALLDPAGRYVQGASVLSSAVMVWSGIVSERPVRDGTEWSMMVRDQVRRLEDPIGVAASGTAVWTEEDDALVKVPVAMTYRVVAHLEPTSGTILDVLVRPFASYASGDTARLSVLRTAIALALDAAATDAQVTGFAWVKRTVEDRSNVYDLIVQFNPATTDTYCEVLASHVAGAEGLFYSLSYMGGPPSALRGSTALEDRTLYLMQPARVSGVALAVILDEGNVADLPATGMVVIEAGGQVDYVRYSALTVDDTDPAKVHLELERRDRISGADLDAVLASDRSSVSVRFLWADSGTIRAILLRAIASTGDGVNGTWDTLPKGQGLGGALVDEASFSDVFLGLWLDLAFAPYVDSGESIASVYGGILRLARLALVTRRSSDGTAVEIAAVDVGSVDTGVPVEVITDAILVTAAGRRPVRVKDAFRVPQVIEVTARTAPVDTIPAGEAMVTYKDPHLTDWTDERWGLDIYGLSREAIQTVGLGWALSWFRSGENRQVIEIDVPPWMAAQVGDVVLLDLVDPSLWDYATGTPGLTGLARVLGSTLALTTGIVTLTVAADGIYGAGPLCPSIPISVINGGAATPTSIDVVDTYLDLLDAANDSAPDSWRVVCYLPGHDAARAVYTVSTVTDLGTGFVRLTVTAYPSSPAVTLTTSYRITWPVSGDSTTNQNLYVHTDDGRQWS